MRLKQLARTGVEVPEIGLGTWTYHAGPEPLRAGLQAGARFIDTAETYGTEAVVGEAVRGERARVFLATKVATDHFRRADVLAAADRSLRALGTDYIDLYQLHGPNGGVPMEEALGAMEELVDAGKVRFIGVCNFTIAELRRAERAMSRHPLVTNQVRYNLADRTIEGGLLEYCAARHITIIAYSPLARGLPYLYDSDPARVLQEIAGARGKSPAQVALNWCLSRAPVVVIPKSNSVGHVIENCAASDWRLSPEDLRRLDTEFIYRRRSAMEVMLRRALPRSFKQTIHHAVQRLPAGLRRRFN
jgi:diketogulonate reductase-like aldo/keto reductase